MLQKTIKYEDYLGKERTETFFFNLTKAEILEMEVSKEGGLSEYLTKIVSTNKPGEVMAVFKEIVMKAYGEIDPGGNRFVKGENMALAKAFIETEAYSELIMELATDADAAANFVKGIMPKTPNPPPTPK